MCTILLYYDITLPLSIMEFFNNMYMCIKILSHDYRAGFTIVIKFDFSAVFLKRLERA